MSAFGLYVIGFLVLAAGVLVGAYFLGVGTNWLIVIGLVLAGIAIVSGVVNTKRKENPDA
jgi:LPXTG-motif cell wall-anchored protein